MRLDLKLNKKMIAAGMQRFFRTQLSSPTSPHFVRPRLRTTPREEFCVVKGTEVIQDHTVLLTHWTVP